MVSLVKTWWRTHFVLGLCVLALIVLGGLMLEGAGDLYESVADESALRSIDQPVQDWMINNRPPWLTGFVAWFSNTGGPIFQPIITALLAGYFAWRWRSWTPIIITALAGIGALGGTIAGKKIVGRLRPPIEQSIPPYEYSPSFPSGHTLNGIVVAGIVAYLLMHWYRGKLARAIILLLATIYALAMGLSRVYLGHHWLTDVFVGWLLGGAWILAVITLHRVWLTLMARKGVTTWALSAAKREALQNGTTVEDELKRVNARYSTAHEGLVEVVAKAEEGSDRSKKS